MKIKVLIILLSVCLPVFCIDTFVYTPNGTRVYAGKELIDDTDSANLAITRDYVRRFPQVTVIAPASILYNCHGYAWSMSDGAGDTCHIFDLTAYWNDGSYVEVYTEAEADIAFQYDPMSPDSENHSAVVTHENGKYISKWGVAGPLMLHDLDYGQFAGFTEHRFFKKVLDRNVTAQTYSTGEAVPIKGSHGHTVTVSDTEINTGAIMNVNSYTSLTASDMDINSGGILNAAANKATVSDIELNSGTMSIATNTPILASDVNAYSGPSNAGSNQTSVWDIAINSGTINLTSNDSVKISYFDIYPETTLNVSSNSHVTVQSVDIASGSTVEIKAKDYIVLKRFVVKDGSKVHIGGISSSEPQQSSHSNIRSINIFSDEDNYNETTDFEAFADFFEKTTDDMQQTDEMDFTVYPNPANGNFHIKITGTLQPYTVEILNTAGNVLWTTDHNTETVNINRSDLPAGIYYVRLIANGKQSVRKLILE